MTVPYFFILGGGVGALLVGDVINEVKELVQDDDTVRYTQESYINALNNGLAEGYRLRPEFFRGTGLPVYSVGDESETLSWPPQYRLPLILYCVGHLELRDAQGNEDARAAALMTAFVNKLTGLATPRGRNAA